MRNLEGRSPRWPGPGAAALFAMLVACGCGAGEAAQGPAPAAPQAAAATATQEAIDDTLDWAEWAYPEVFKRGDLSTPVSVGGVQLMARRYQGSWGTRLLGITSDGRVFGQGDFTDGILRGYGQLADWAAQVSTHRCVVYRFDPACGSAPRPVRSMALEQYHVSLVRGAERRLWSWRDGRYPNPGFQDLGVRAGSLAAGPGMVLQLSDDGRVSGWGWFEYTDDGQIFDPNMGRPASVPYYTLPAPFYFPSRIVQVTWGWYGGALALRADGSLWLRFGPLAAADHEGRLVRYSATRWVDLPPMRSLARGIGGPASMLAIDAHGRSWRIRPVGTGSPDGLLTSMSAMPLDGLPPWRDAVCDGFNCLALAEDGRVWAWGDNSDGQLGQGEAQPLMRGDPQPVPGLTGIVDVGMAGSAMFAIDAGGRLWSWGGGPIGRAAAQPPGQPQPVPMAVPLVEVIGSRFSSDAGVLARDRDGGFWAWGTHPLWGTLTQPTLLDLRTAGATR